MADRFADFNPRARVGRDEPIILRQNITANFNPRARVGRDAWASFWRGVVPDFNPRARVGRDSLFPSCLTLLFAISIHAPA